MKKVLLFLGSFIGVVLIVLSIILLSAGNVEYMLEKEYNAKPEVVLDVMSNMKYWPEWQKGIKATRILEENDYSTIYEVVHLDDEMEFRDTVKIEYISSNYIVSTVSNEFFHLTKKFTLDETPDSNTILKVHYIYETGNQIKRFLLSPASSYLEKDSREELERLAKVIADKQ